MSDDFNTFMAKTDAMLALAEKQTRAIVQTWMMKCSAKLVLMTPGPDNQWPDVEKYIAVGRLRMGWTWSLSAPGAVPANRDRPQIDQSGDASATRAKLDSEITALGLHGETFLYNEVGYGYYVHWGLGRGHSSFGSGAYAIDLSLATAGRGPRPYVLDFVSAHYAETLLAEAAAEVKVAL